jgi:hypothetical protein
MSTLCIADAVVVDETDLPVARAPRMSPERRWAQYYGAADGPVSSAASQDSRACKHKRSGVDVVDETAGIRP